MTNFAKFFTEIEIFENYFLINASNYEKYILTVSEL